MSSCGQPMHRERRDRGRDRERKGGRGGGPCARITSCMQTVDKNFDVYMVFGVSCFEDGFTCLKFHSSWLPVEDKGEEKNRLSGENKKKKKKH